MVAGKILLVQVDPEAAAAVRSEVGQVEEAGSVEEALGRLDGADALVLSQRVEDPVGAARQVYARDRDLAVVVLCDRALEPRLRHALERAPLLGDATCSPAGRAETLGAVLLGAASRSRRRRAYSGALAAAGSPAEPPDLEFPAGVLEHAPFGIVPLDEAGLILGWGPGARALLGGSERDLVGTPFAEVAAEAAGAAELSDCRLPGGGSIVFVSRAGGPSPSGLEQALLDVSADGITVQDHAGRLVQANAAAAVLLGFLSARELLRAPGAEVLRRFEAHDEHGEPVPAAQVGERPERLLRLTTLPDRAERWVAVRTVSLGDGRDRLVVTVFRDVTERRRIEELVATVAHELRTPLAAVRGAALTLRRDDVELDAGQRETLLGVIAAESGRLTRMVNDVLSVGRAEAGLLSVAVERCDAGELVRGVVAAEQVNLPANIRLRVTVPPGLPPVAADPDKLRQVLVNLVDNAVKYSPGGGEVEVAVEEAGGEVRFTVRDEGPGVRLEERDRIFERFYRSDSGRGVAGTGLGLAISRELVERMGGRIWLESGAGRGSAFRVALPAHARRGFD